MSIDMVRSNAELRREPVNPLVRSSVHSDEIVDLVFIFGGWAGPLRGGRSTIATEQPNDVGQLARRVRGMRTLPNHRVMVFDYNPTINSPLGFLRTPLIQLATYLDHLGHLIIYGFSAGGYNALVFSKLIWRDNAQLSRSADTFYRTYNQVDSGLQSVIRIDYLITIDPALDSSRTDNIDRGVPPCVRRNLDYYQTTPNIVGSRGGTTYAMNSRTTYVRSRNRTAELEVTEESPHGFIDNYTYSTVARKIQEALLLPAYFTRLSR